MSQIIQIIEMEKERTTENRAIIRLHRNGAGEPMTGEYSVVASL